MSEEKKNEPIAIVGMSCRLPGSNNVDEYWKIFSESRSVIRNVPEGRWSSDKVGIFSRDAQNVKNIFFYGFFNNLFILKYFKISSNNFRSRADSFLVQLTSLTQNFLG